VSYQCARNPYQVHTVLRVPYLTTERHVSIVTEGGLRTIMDATIEVTVTIGDKQVTFAGPEAFVRSEVQRLTNIVAANVPDSFLATPSEGTPPASQSGTERGFVSTKQPTGHSEMVAVLAYYLTKSGFPEFTPADMKRAYARAGQRPPKVMSQALRDAKNTHDYLEPSTKRGAFRLSAHGERTVEFDLPRKKPIK
jgi:hypothetical protein